MFEIEKIRTSFVPNNGSPTGVACLLAILNLYDKELPDIYLFRLKQCGNRIVTLSELKQVAIELGLYADIRLLDVEELKDIQSAVILFFEDELGKKDYAVYYGFDGKRFILGEPGSGLMQYLPKEMETMWIQGISLIIALEPDTPFYSL